MKRSRTGLLIASAATVGTLFVVPVAQAQPGVTSVDSAEKPAPSKGTQPGTSTPAPSKGTQPGTSTPAPSKGTQPGTSTPAPSKGSQPGTSTPAPSKGSQPGTSTPAPSKGSQPGTSTPAPSKGSQPGASTPVVTAPPTREPTPSAAPVDKKPTRVEPAGDYTDQVVVADDPASDYEPASPVVDPAPGVEDTAGVQDAPSVATSEAPREVAEQAPSVAASEAPREVAEQAPPRAGIAGGTVTLTGPGFAAEVNGTSEPLAGSAAVQTAAGVQSVDFTTENGGVEINGPLGEVTVPDAQVKQVQAQADMAFKALPQPVQQQANAINAQVLDAAAAQPAVSHYDMGIVNATVVVDHWD